MTKGISQSKTLIKHISCECRWEFDGTQCSSKQKLNKNKCWCDCKNQ